MSALRVATTQGHSASLARSNALEDPLFGGGDDDDDSGADGAFPPPVHVRAERPRRCCCFRGSKKACLLFSLAVVGVVVALLLFMYFVLLRLFVETTLNSAAINVTLMRVGAPVSPTQAPVVASLSAEVDVPNLNFTVHFTDTTLGYFPPGEVPGQDGAASVTLGTMGDMSNTPITVEHNTSRALLEVAGVLTVNDLGAFGDFGQVVLEQPNITADLSSHLEIDVEVWGMHFAVNDVKLNRALTFDALDGVPNVTLTVFTATMATDGTRRVIVSATIVVGNPTIVAISTLGNITIELLYQNSSLGIFASEEPTLQHGANTLVVVGALEPTNMTALNDMLSNFLSGIPAPLQALGRTSSFPLFDGLIGGLNIDANLTSKNSDLLESALVNVTIAAIERIIKTGDFVLPVSVRLLNPFECPIQIKSLDLQVTYQNTSVGFFNNTLDVLIPAGRHSRTPYVMVAALPGHDKELVRAMLGELREGYVMLGATGSFTAQVGNLAVAPNYFQGETIPTCPLAIPDQCE